MNTSNSALLLAEARLHRDLSHAHEEYARSIIAAAGESDEAGVPELRGRVQKRIVGLPEMYVEAGMSASDIARRLQYDEANTYGVLKALTETGVAEEVQGQKPRRWRMATKHRRARVLRMSRLIPDGRWTTYGDFSIAVYDNVKMAITVGQVAAKNPAFVNPHRVLWSGGVIPDKWSDDEGNGPEECERRLREEGIDVKDRVANGGRFIDWEELKEILERDEEATEI
ncbi:MAG: MGMT family protein [Solirubrobacterales bacterium]